jgi:hypothetical protein
MKNQSLPKVLRITAIVFLFITSLNALAAGYSFMVEPSGEGLGITTDYLKPSAPFTNYFIPGIILFSLNGVLCGVIAVQLTMVRSFHPLHLIISLIGPILIVIGYSLRQVPTKVLAV